MSETPKNQAARRLGSISAVPAVQARVRDNVIVPRSTVVPRRSNIPAAQRKKISPFYAFIKGLVLSFRDIVFAPFEVPSTNRVKNYVVAIMLFAATPIVVSSVFILHAPLQESLRLVAFLSSNVVVFLGVSAITTVVRSIRRPLKTKMTRVMERGRQS